MRVAVNIRGLREVIAKNKARSAALVPSRLLSVGIRAGLRAEVKARRRLSARRATIQNRVTTGKLAASIHSEATAIPDGFRIDTGSNLIYARIQQEGGIVKPKPPLKLLAIPANKAVARSGLMPRDFSRGSLRFVPITGKPHLKGLLIRARAPEQFSTATLEIVKTKREKRLDRLRQESYKDRRKWRKISSSTQASDLLNRAARRRQSRKSKRGEEGEVLFKLIDMAKIPRRPYLLYDAEDKARIGAEIARIIANPYDSALRG